MTFIVALLLLVYSLSRRTFIKPTRQFISHIEYCAQGDPGKVKPTEAWMHWFQIVEDKENAARKRSPRVVYTGSPPIFPNLKIPLLIEQSDAIIVADETCSSNRMFNDMVSVDEWFVNDMVDFQHD